MPDIFTPTKRSAVMSLIRAHGNKATEIRLFANFRAHRNRARDRLVTRTLRASGWRVLRLWEHDLARKREPRLLARLHRALN